MPPWFRPFLLLFVGIRRIDDRPELYKLPEQKMLVSQQRLRTDTDQQLSNKLGPVASLPFLRDPLSMNTRVDNSACTGLNLQ